MTAPQPAPAAAETPAESIAHLREAWAAAEAAARLAAAEAWFETDRRGRGLRGEFEPAPGTRERIAGLRGKADAARDAWLGALVAAGFAEVAS